MSENSDTSDSVRSSSILTGSRLNNIVRTSVLRPSLFGSSQLGGAGTTDDQSKTEAAGTPVNPFVKEDENTESEASGCKIQENDKPNEKIDPLNLLTKNGMPKSNLFESAKSSMPLVESSGFVFGQNVHERVIGENIQGTLSVENAKGESDSSNQSSSSTSNLLFSSVMQNKKGNENSEDTEKVPKETDSKSLTEVAREYEESRAQKRKYDEVETFTGEENEVNVIDVNCKLFAFVNANWEERGRGSLRLNDSKDSSECSRVVFRTSGNLRLLLNTKIWPGMVAERPSPKSLRLTAMDNTGQIKIFLIMSRPDDINTLFKALSQRVEAAQKQTIESGESSFSNSDSDHNKTDESNNGQIIIDNNTAEPSPKKPVIELNK